MRTTFMLLSLALSATLIGCGTSGPGKGNGAKDSDSDGLTDTQEATFGTDSASPDTDADGLTDKEEFDLGTSGTNADSDADGYLDFDEVTEGSNPADAGSMIYTGGWPYYANKDSITDPGLSSSPDSGATFPRLQLTDQFGETVDIYDYAYQGKPIIVDLSGEGATGAMKSPSGLSTTRPRWTTPTAAKSGTSRSPASSTAATSCG